jgi:hypothetical protein
MRSFGTLRKRSEHRKRAQSLIRLAGLADWGGHRDIEYDN